MNGRQRTGVAAALLFGLVFFFWEMMDIMNDKKEETVQNF